MPMLRPITLSALIILGHISLKIFDLVYTMTGKGPAFATDMPGIYMFETTFRGNHYAEGAAISMVMFLMVALIIIPYLYRSLRKEAD
jgi:glucose/mannose transport system permease protein